MIEFGTTLSETISEIPQSGGSTHFVAPFATEIFYDNPEVRYETFLDGDSEMVAVSSFLRALLHKSGFNGQWMLVVDWHNVHSSYPFVSENMSVFHQHFLSRHIRSVYYKTHRASFVFNKSY